MNEEATGEVRCPVCGDPIVFDLEFSAPIRRSDDDAMVIVSAHVRRSSMDEHEPCLIS